MAANNQTVTDTDTLTEPNDVDVDEEPADEPVEGETGESTEAEPLPLDQVFEILKNKRRRTVLHYLDDNEEPVSLSDLAEHVAADENDTTVRQVTSRERKCAYVGLYQCHLPKMDSMDIIEFNQSRGRIELGPNASQLEQYLGQSETTGRPWPLYYGSLAAAGSVLVLATSLVAGPGLAPIALSLALLASIVGLAAVDLQSERGTEPARNWLHDHVPL